MIHTFPDNTDWLACNPRLPTVTCWQQAIDERAPVRTHINAALRCLTPLRGRGICQLDPPGQEGFLIYHEDSKSTETKHL